MHITGIIAEYNPFHNGHLYHMEEARRITDADYCIAVISGNFVQRGAPAIIDKYARTRMALQNGADLVIELPLYYSTGSAEFFAHGAVTLLDRLGCVDFLCFGSECGSLSPLSDIASLLVSQPAQYRLTLQQAVKQGTSFPKARSQALLACLSDAPKYEAVLSSPNNILGIEYLKALIKNKSTITPYTIKRQGSGYHDSALNNAALAFSSASAIRSTVKDHSLSHIRQHVPLNVYELLDSCCGRSFPVLGSDFSSLLHYRLLLNAPEGFQKYMDVSEDLSDKIIRSLYRFQNYEQFCGQLKSKNLTYSRISRALVHILLSMTDRQFEQWKDETIYYARILGFRRTCTPLLKLLKAHTSIPLVSKLADASSYLTPSGLAMLEKDIQAAHIYDSVTASKFHTPFINEYSKRLVILE